MVVKYNKLVRDKIPEHVRKKGGKPVFHVADDREYWRRLKEKLLEEVKEFLQDESVEEMADVQEVIDAICRYKDFGKTEIELIRKKKLQERGAFNKKIILDES